jgi:hypothetical protein
VASELSIWNRAAIAAGETQPINSKQDPAQAAVLLSFLYDDAVRELLAFHPWTWAKAQAGLVQVADQSIDYIGDGGTVEYLIPYDNSDASQIAVTINGVEKTVGTHWTYTEPTDGFQGKVTFLVAPAAASAIKITVVTRRTGWDFIYAVPANCVKPLALLGEGQRQSMIVDPSERVPFEVMVNNGESGFLICTNDDSFETLEYTRLVRNAGLYPSHFVEALVRRLAAPLIEAIPKKPKEARLVMQDCFVWLNEAIRVDNESVGEQETPPSPGEVARW